MSDTTSSLLVTDILKNLLSRYKNSQVKRADKIKLINPFPIEPELVPIYLNAADVLLLTSFSEGSPNIIKEALACNCPIVSTDVGDVKENFKETSGNLICSYEAESIAKKIEFLLKSDRRTNSRGKIEHLDRKKIAKKIIGLYNEIKDS